MLFHPPIKLAGPGPGGCLDRDGWIDFTALSLGKLLHVLVAEIHN
jgi:hypothetical protein